eukprot:Cvel_24306.t2-p1 / transcript=Cvel_24306.t2 / gene=Cvel_24306 / organism=Chromera_velia_CCMP2878 / gene_product=hypothetical protein / transcript_product=hypothetical protein / location=Cvel_scaffold2611:1858-3724(+) / protein_length=426 / sequence_SO=supercontig / SO=protein_coding / is_pseudo=false
MLEQERLQNRKEELQAPFVPLECELPEILDFRANARSSSASPFPTSNTSSLVSAAPPNEWTHRSALATPHTHPTPFSFGPVPTTFRGDPSMQTCLGRVVASFEAFHGFSDDPPVQPEAMTRIRGAVEVLERYIHAEDIMWTLAHASVLLEPNHRALDAAKMTRGNREWTALIQIYLSHCHLLDEPLWLSLWKDHIFPETWSIEDVNTLVFHFFETQGFGLRVDDQELRMRMQMFVGACPGEGDGVSQPPRDHDAADRFHPETRPALCPSVMESSSQPSLGVTESSGDIPEPQSVSAQRLSGTDPEGKSKGGSEIVQRDERAPLTCSKFQRRHTDMIASVQEADGHSDHDNVGGGEVGPSDGCDVTGSFAAAAGTGGVGGEGARSSTRFVTGLYGAGDEGRKREGGGNNAIMPHFASGTKRGGETRR